MSEIRLPRLLDHDLVEKARIRPDRASVTINLAQLSTANVTLPDGAPKASIHDFMEIYGPNGSLGVFRVSAERTTPGNSQQITLEHGLATLGDSMTSAETALSGSMKDMLGKLLAFQDKVMWKLGDVDVSGTLPDMDTGLTNLLEIVMAVVAEDETAMLAFDQSVFPWVLHVRKKPTAAECECRLNRNVYGVNISLDDSELCTRVTVEDWDGKLHTYNADTTGTWGIVHKAITIDEGQDAEKEGKKYLEEHKNPAVSIELDALELSRQTGEPFDKFVIGTICRTALPEWGITLDERILSLNYPDVYGQQNQVRLTLSTRRGDAPSSFASLYKQTATNTSVSRQNLKYYRELDNRAIIMAEQIELRATKEELGKYLNEVYIELDAHDASITLNAQHIDKITDDITAAGIRIDGLNATLTQYAGIVDSHGGLISGAILRLDGLESSIELKVSKNGIISAINLSTEGAVIQANRIDLRGYVTADQLEVKVADIEDAWATYIRTVGISCDGISGGTADFDDLVCGGFYATEATIGGYATAWKSQRVVTSVSAPSLGWNTKRIYYVDHEGNNQSELVCTGFTGTTTPETNTTTVYYLGR